MAEDYYALLGVRRDASQDEIKRAYRRLARELHPDVNPDPETQEKFKEINQAYEVLQDTDKRQMYDMGGDPFATAGAGAGGFGGFGAAGFPFSEFVDAVFGATGQAARGPRSRARRGRNATIRIELDLSECAFGATRELTVDTAVVCPTCSGEGTAPGTHPATCEVCQGRGEISQVRRSFLGQVVTSQPCPNCGGYGTVLPRPCPECDGDGRVRSRRTMKVRIPAGVEDGTHIQLAGEGETGPGGGPPGDLFLEVVQKPHAIFERQGDDLHCTLTIPMVAAALGATVSVESLDGPNDVDVRPGTQSGQVLPLYGLGVKHLNGSGRGDLIIHVTVETPSRLDPEQEKLLRDLAKLRGEEAPPGKFQPGQQGFFSRLRDAFNGRLAQLSRLDRRARYQRAVRASRVAAATAPAVDVRSTVGPSRASIAPASREGGALGRADAALGADDQQDVALVRQSQLVELERGVRLKDDRAGGGRHPFRQGGGAGRGRDLGQPGAAGLLGGLAGGGAPLGEGALAPVALPPGDGALGRPREHGVDADLGHQLDRELAPVALRQRLRDDQPRLRRRDRARHPDLNRDRVLADGGDHSLGQRPGAVADVRPLARPQAAHRGRVMALRAGQRQGRRAQLAGPRQEDRRARGRRERFHAGHSSAGRRRQRDSRARPDPAGPRRGRPTRNRAPRCRCRWCRRCRCHR